MNPDGSNLRLLTPPATGGFLADWSPSGEFLAFSNHCCNPPLASILTTRNDKEKLRQVTHNGGIFNDIFASWSPEGNEIVFRRRNPIDGSVGIWIVSTSSAQRGSIHQIPATKMRMRSPRLMHQLRAFGSTQSKALGGAAASPKQIEDGGTYPRWGVAQ